MIAADDDAPPAQASPGNDFRGAARTRRLGLAVCVLLVALLIFVSVPSLHPNQSLTLLCAPWTWVGSTLFIAPLLLGDNTYCRRLTASVAGQAFVWLNPQGLFAGMPADAVIAGLFATSATLYVQLNAPNCTANCQGGMQSRDTGASWSPFNPLFQGQPVYLMATGADGRTLLGQAVYDDANPLNRVYLRSTDGGDTWSALPPHPEDLVAGSMTATPDGTVYAAFDKSLSNVGTTHGIYKVAPGASAWSYVAPAPSGGTFTVVWDAAGHPVALWGRVDRQQPTAGLERHQP